MAISVVQSKSYYGYGNNAPPVTFSSNVTAGNTIIVVTAAAYNGNTDYGSMSVSDNHSTTYQTAQNITFFETYLAQYYYQAVFFAYNVPTGATTVTVTSINGTCCGDGNINNNTDTVLTIYEVSGLGTINPLDQKASASKVGNTGTTTGTTPSITTTSASEIIVTSEFLGSTTITPTISTSGYTTSANGLHGNIGSFTSGYQIVSSLGSYSVSYANASTIPGWLNQIASFKVGVTNPNSSFMAFF